MNANLPPWLRRAADLVARPAVLATLAVVLMSAALWNTGNARIEDFSSTLIGIRKLVSGDSEHYLAIADAFENGDWSMEYVAPGSGPDRAHRQPGYPALLALAQHLGVQGAPELARVNLAVLVASLWIAFVGAGIATRSWPAAMLAAGAVYGAGFLFDIATARLLTEPLYVAVALAAAGSCLAYAERPGGASLLLTAAFAAMAYLVRVNGLFLAAALGLALVVADVIRARREDPPAPLRELPLHLPLAAYAGAFAMFLVVAAPSWVPRAIHAGNPVYHGYLNNFLWVDDYESAHVPGPPRFSATTYFDEHGVRDVVERARFGLDRVFRETPLEKYGIATSVALVLALLVLVVLRDAPGLVIACAGVLQALPLAWTALANPARRLPATALLPFVALVLAAAAAAALKRAHGDDRP